jgi:Na+/proline symporter
MMFLLMAPRLHALGKERGYITISQFIFDRYSPPAGARWVSGPCAVCCAVAWCGVPCAVRGAGVDSEQFVAQSPPTFGLSCPVLLLPPFQVPHTLRVVSFLALQLPIL